MKLSEIRPCDACKGPIATGSYLLRLSLLIVSPKAAQQTLGLSMIFGGHLAPGALSLAEVFSPDPEVVKVAGDEVPELWTEAFVCQRCALFKPLDLAMLLEKRGNAKDAAERERETEGESA